MKKIEKFFLNRDFSISNEETLNNPGNKMGKKSQLRLEVEEKETSVVIKLATLCVSFEDQIKEAAVNFWPGKDIEVGYKSDIKLEYMSYKAFVDIVHNKK